MKRRLALLPLLLVALPACAGGLARPVDAPGAYYESSVPLRARLVDGAGGLAIRMNRPAHVAVFEVVPGRGMGLMYPAHGSDRSHIAEGFFRLSHDRLRPYTWYYAGNSGLYAASGPRYYLLVASRAPLRIDRFQNDPGAIREWFGLRRFTALDARPAMDELVETVVPAQADEDWDTDLLTVWPQDSRTLFDDSRRVRVVCNDGVVITTTWETAHVACQLFNNRPSSDPAPPQRPDTVAPQPLDSVQVPTRRRPEPRSTDEDGDERAAAPRRPHLRPVERDDATDDTHVVRRNPPRDAVDEQPRARERELFRGRDEAPRGRPDAAERRERESRPAAVSEGARNAPRREAPRSETPKAETSRRESPREAPQRPETSRPEPRPEPARVEPPRTPAPESPRERGGDPR